MSSEAHESSSSRTVRQDSERNQKPDPGCPVVAVGASAGGLEAFTELLHHLRADTGMAFVLIQHLAPNHESMLAQLLSRQTAMAVHQVEDGAVLSPNQVYVIPPNAAMTLSGRTFVIGPRQGAGTAVDGFLRSLATSQKNKAVAVILSGTGSDGALGVQAIAEEGGVVFAQTPESAKFDSMPRAAIATGCVDFILAADKIGTELARIAREPRLIPRDVPEVPSQSHGSGREFQAVFDLLRQGTGIDFRLYRQTTVRRRILRRLALLRKESLGEYVTHLRANSAELHALAQDILIRVTRFFRDPEVFDVLSRKVFPALIRKTPLDRAARVWVAGCSTGEEAYSIAICFLEVAEQMQSQVHLQVFATDINEAAIEKARRGAYVENIAADVSPERLVRFFVRVGHEYQVGKRLRDLCIFCRHDLLNDPPFSRMNLVSCRNVLIYLDDMQAQAFSRFHFALNPGGCLLLGKSETTMAAPGLFAAVDKEAKLYARQDSARHQVLTNRKSAPLGETLNEALLAVQPRRRIDVGRSADRILTERYSPPYVVVDLNLEVVPFGGENSALAADARNIQLVAALKDAQLTAFRNAIQSSARTRLSFRIEQVKLAKIDFPGEIDIEVTPLGPDQQHFLVVFEQQAGSSPPEPEPDRPRAGGRLQVRTLRLEKEIAASRAHLESVILEQEAAREEVVAANEELQSLNEELESSKEELEATNEELNTLNQELHVRNTELGNSQEFAQATIDTVRGALVVLGADLRVLKANQYFYQTFGLSPEEVEHHFIYEVGHGAWSLPRLRVLLEEVLPESQNLSDFEIEQSLPSGARRVLQLNARRFEYEERILLAIEDVTERRRLEDEARQSHKMEAIGYLAAGVAHDFNNLLTGIIGNASLVLDSLPEGSPERSQIETVVAGGQRAAELTRQLLAYAGKGRFYLERVNLSELIMQTGKLIHPSIPQKVQVRLDLDQHIPLLLADPGQLSQVVTNLMINAVEAIGENSGIVQVRTGTQRVAQEPLQDIWPGQNPAAGEYAFLEVLDNGSGMDEETKQRVFDPFFSTKFTGRGLGLAAVLGIVRQHNGAVQLHSVRGRGTSFRILFPVGERVPSPTTVPVSQDLRGSGTLLIVDDEELIRKFMKSALEPFGYRVLEARDGAEAVGLVRDRRGEIALVLLDYGMPGMNGLQTLEKIREFSHDVPVMVCSGFGELDIETCFAEQKVAAFMPKPYTVKQLAKKVKDCMAQR